MKSYPKYTLLMPTIATLVKVTADVTELAVVYCVANGMM